jgi:hypothetical protein
MLRSIEGKKIRRLTKYCGPTPGPRRFGADAHRERECLKAFAGLSKKRRRKLLSIRRQLMANTYNIERRLDAVLDKVLQDAAN